MMYPLFSVLFWLILGGACFYVAKQRGRNPTAWFAIGIVLGIIGLILLYILPSKKTLNASPSLAVSKGQKEEISVNPNDSAASLLPPSPPSFHSKLWYYLNEENKRYGPMSFNALNQKWIDGDIKCDTYVWNEEMSDWKLIEELPEVLTQLKT